MPSNRHKIVEAVDEAFIYTRKSNNMQKSENLVDALINVFKAVFSEAVKS